YRAEPDWDVATDARPEEVLHLFRRTVPVGVEHGTVGVLSRGRLFEVTTFRRDIETDGRHATVRFAETIHEDLERRDFTINAMAWRPSTGEVEDPHGGASDLAEGVLRAVGTPEERFREDYLRILRGFRFAGRFDLEIEPETRRAMREAVPGLSGLSAERIREELMKVLEDERPSTALELYTVFGALDHWYPELARPAADRARWMKTLAAVDALRPHRGLLRAARLLAAVSDDAAERGEASAALLERLRFSNADRRTVTRRAEAYLPFVGPMDSSAEQRRWLSDTGPAWRDVFRMHMADARAAGTDRAAGYIVATWRAVHDVWLERPPLSVSDLAIRGDDVLELGVPRGPLVGLVLDELLQQTLEDPTLNDREALLGEAARLVEMGWLVPGESADGR
ncbi:MAG: CCA tRNA nucleotidyltransferase, partial [Gemmatimonadota bacterium]|nr:CCA tRNA nucleotidyltransferase [Gemmatimonadota bacterium]